VPAVIDLFSRRVVGWSMSAEVTAQLATDALVMAIWRQAATSLRSRQPIHQRAVPETDGRSRRHLLDEPLGQRLGQRRDEELLLVTEDRACSA
jgi:transposase InsO family protein